MPHTVLTPPELEPISLADARAQCRASVADDEFLALAIRGARAKCEGLLQKALINRTLRQLHDQFDNAGLRFDLEPLVSVQSVSYTATDGSTQTIAGSGWQVAAAGPYPLLLPAWGLLWPTARQVPGAVQVNYVAGHGATAAAVPDDIRTWLLLTIGTIYTQRESSVAGAIQPIPGRFYDSLLDPHRRYGF